MTEATTTPAAAEAAKALTVKDDMDSRRVFLTPADAAAYIAKCANDYADFGGYPIAANGVSADEDSGEIIFDPEIYNDAMDVAVALLTQRGDANSPSTIKAIVVYPSPKIDSVMDTPAGREWLVGIMQKEINHVAVRGLRKAEDADGIADAVQAMPSTIEDYITSGRDTGGSVLETYNLLWKTIKDAMAKRAKAFGLANLSKKEMRKAMESASYAGGVYPTLELRKNKAGADESLFYIAALFGQQLAKAQSLDSTLFDRMLTTRNEKDIELGTDDGDEDFDLEAMTAAVLKKDAAPATEPAADSAPVEPAADTDGAAA